MCKIPHIISLFIISFLCVSCKTAMIDNKTEEYSEVFNETMPEITSDIDETFHINPPDKSGFTPYAVPDLVAKEEFEHSEYMLMVRSSRHRFTAEMIPLYSYAFLGEHANSFEEGNEIYNKLNSMYSKEYPYLDLPESYLDVMDVGQEEALKDHFFKGSVIFVSSDGKRVLLQSRLFEGMLKHIGEGYSVRDANGTLKRIGDKDMIVERYAWNQLLEIYDGKNSIYEKMYRDDNPYQSAPYIYDFFGSVFDLNGFIIYEDTIINYIEKSEKKINIEDGYILHIPNATNKFLFLRMDAYQKQISIHNLIDGKRLALINYPDYNKPGYFEITQFTNDERIVVLFPIKIPYIEEDDIEGFYEENVYTNDAYVMNVDGSEAKYLGDYMFNPYISPDGKYIAYTGMSGTDHQEYCNDINNMADMKDGFYIKNIETNQTIYYPVENTYEYNIVGWVNKKGLEKLLN